MSIQFTVAKQFTAYENIQTVWSVTNFEIRSLIWAQIHKYSAKLRNLEIARLPLIYFLTISSKSHKLILLAVQWSKPGGEESCVNLPKILPSLFHVGRMQVRENPRSCPHGAFQPCTHRALSSLRPWVMVRFHWLLSMLKAESQRCEQCQAKSGLERIR